MQSIYSYSTYEMAMFVPIIHEHVLHHMILRQLRINGCTCNVPLFLVQVSTDLINTVTAKSPMIYVSLYAPLHKMYEHIIYIFFLTKKILYLTYTSKNLKGTLNKPISRIKYSCIFSFFKQFIYIYIYLSQVSKAVSNSCPVSRETVQIVDNCPDTEQKWREAAAKKNCAAYASNCSDPEKLVYHCVINAYVNQTLEVCAYSRIIVFGEI